MLSWLFVMMVPQAMSSEVQAPETEPRASEASTWSKVQRFWHSELGPMFAIHADNTGNVRDIKRAYAAGEASSSVPMGAGLRWRNVVQVPMGEVSPAAHFQLMYQNGRNGGSLEGYGPFENRAERVDLRAGLGLCHVSDTCVFAAYNHRILSTVNDRYPISNLASVLGEIEAQSADSFVEPYLRGTLGDTLVDLLLAQVDFDGERVTTDLTDRVVTQGVSLVAISGATQRISTGGSVGWSRARQQHTSFARVVPVDDPDQTTEFSYAYDRAFDVLDIDFAVSFSLLPDRYPVGAALGLFGDAILIVDLAQDRNLGAYVTAGAFVGVRWGTRGR